MTDLQIMRVIKKMAKEYEDFVNKHIGTIEYNGKTSIFDFLRDYPLPEVQEDTVTEEQLTKIIKEWVYGHSEGLYCADLEVELYNGAPDLAKKILSEIKK